MEPTLHNFTVRPVIPGQAHVLVRAAANPVAAVARIRELHPRATVFQVASAADGYKQVHDIEPKDGE